jgi:predicted  nucleic acid-binding Zn-ribbon protein
VKLDVLTLPFDQYQRYRLVSDLVNEVRGKRETFRILDVGGRTGLLRAFLPKDDVALVDLEPSDVPGLVLGDGSRLPFKDDAFDIVATFDTLEHVPPARRAAFVSECARVAQRWVFIAGPYQSREVEEAERILQRFLVDKLEVEHRYLEEHRHNGLPSLADTVALLEKGGAKVGSIGHGNLERWLALMSLSMYLDYEPRLRPLAARVFRFYNENLYASDHAHPVYRHAVVAAFDGARMPQGTSGLEAPIAPRGVLERFREVADEVVSFDRARTDWREERARLAEILATLERDLAGHRSSLAVATSALATEREQALHMRAELEADLASHRSETAHLRQVMSEERAQSEAAIAALTLDLEGHRAQKAELEGLVAQHEAVVRDVAADLDHHRRSLAEAQIVADAQRAILDEQRAVIDEQHSLIDEQKAGIEDLRSTLADRQAAVEALTAHGRALAESLADRESQIAKLRDVERALERDLAGHKKVLEEARADLERHKKTVQALESELARHRREHAAAVAAYEKDLLEHKQVQVTIAADLAERKKVLVATEADLVEHKKVLQTVGNDLEGHRRLAADLRAELERARAEQERLLAELTRANQDIAGKSTEIANAARALAEQDALIGLLRTDLRDRWKSIKRAVGPRRPTPGEPAGG